MHIRRLTSAPAVALISTALISAGLAAPAVADDAPSGPDLTVTGVIARTADTEATFIVAGNSVVSIEPDAVAGLAPGTTVEASLAIPAATARALRVTKDVDLGSANGAAVAEAQAQPFAVTTITKASSTTAAATTAKQNVDVAVNMNSSGYADGFKQPTDTQIRDAIATSSAYWVRNTGGKFPGFTVRTIKHYRSTLGCDEADDDEWAAEGAAQVGHTLEGGYLSSTATSHLVVIGECRHDGKSGIGTVGDSLQSGGFVVVEADMFSDGEGGPDPDSYYFLDGLLTHEFGHNFSLNHANAQYLSDCDFSEVPAYTDIDVCDTEEYGDFYSVMGYTIPEWWAPLLDIARRDQLGVADSSMLAKQVGLTAKTYALKPLGASSGLRGVKISAPSGDTYYVEYRDGTGESDALYMDKWTGCASGWEPSSKCEFSEAISPAGPGVRVLKLEDDGSTEVEGVNTQKQAPGWDEWALDTGDWWRSPSGDVNIAITSAKSGTASITVTTGAMATVPLGDVQLNRHAVAGRSVTVVPDSSAPAGTTFTYRWFQDGIEIAGATKDTYTPVTGTEGEPLTVRVEGRATGYAPAQNVLTIPVYGAVPVISGTPRVNEALGVVYSEPQVPNDATVSYQWMANGTDIPEATNATYTPLPADVGAKISVRVTSVWTGDSLAVTSQEAGPVALGINWAIDTAPQVSGVFTVGQVLTATAGESVPTSTDHAFQWLRDGVAIPGATSSTYALTQADYGAIVGASVTHTRTGFVPFVMSATGALVDGGVANTVPPALEGAVRVGNPISVSGHWAANFELSYQWLLNGQPIDGATGATYAPIASDLGQEISVTVTGTHATFGSVTLTTDPSTVAIGELAGPTPTISGTVFVGHTLTVVHGTWTPGTAFTYRWYANGVAITGATGKTYKVSSYKAGKVITVTVSGSQAGFTDLTQTSAAKGVPIVGTVSVSGTVKVGHTLTANHGTWTSGTAFTYQWYASGVKISGATGKTYKVTSGKAGKTLTVHITGRRADYTTVTRATSKTKPVAR